MRRREAKGNRLRKRRNFTRQKLRRGYRDEGLLKIPSMLAVKIEERRVGSVARLTLKAAPSKRVKRGVNHLRRDLLRYAGDAAGSGIQYFTHSTEWLPTSTSRYRFPPFNIAQHRVVVRTVAVNANGSVLKSLVQHNLSGIPEILPGCVLYSPVCATYAQSSTTWIARRHIRSASASIRSGSIAELGRGCRPPTRHPSRSGCFL